MMSLEKCIFVIGLALDIIGARFLAQGFIAKRLDDLTLEGTSGWGSPPNLRYISSALQQKAEAEIGFWFLAIGFLAQTIDYFIGSTISGRIFSPYLVFIFLILVGVTLWIVGKLIRKYRVEHLGLKMAAIVYSKSNGRQENATWICKIGEYLLPQLKRSATEKDEDFALRVHTLIENNAKSRSAE